ncbi:MAG: 50S ribosomal protein L25 [Planctomycetaceae bacterium]|jgi:large subunit ribosomal protein L25|nr:50S ribosomal protein L25 [Planctomycetaceae bacterium]
MAEVAILNVEFREEFGKRVNRRLRASGKVPAILYGHKEKNVSLLIPVETLDAALRHGNRFVQLTGALREKALIKECQWDTWGKDVLHVDLARVSEHEKIKVVVPLELRGEAPGAKDGGVVKLQLHEIELECEASAVPEKIDVNINHLEFGQLIHVSDLHIPASSTVLTEQTLLVVSCAEAVEVSEEKAAADGAEPEVIGRKKEDEKSEE